MKTEEDVKVCIAKQKELLNNAIAHLEKELAKIRAGKASPSMLAGVKVDYYGNLTPLEQVSAINTPDAKQIVVQPWEKNMLVTIEKALLAANLGFTPQNTGEIIRITLPPLTEERRRELVKMCKTETENSKVVMRNIRRDTNEEIKKMTKDGLSEDLGKKAEKDIQDQTDSYIKKTDVILAIKEKEIMTV
ncbi:MAG: ribosome recycling factor [Bacteroidales bacterium]|jgi:ribosome recycling factor|nr:ribosome recycling factor [Bacteroidales bacterium]